VAPDPEVHTRRGRRVFTAEYKARIVREADATKGSGEVGALLRREGLYSSHLVHWRAQRAEAQQRGLAPRKRGPKGKSAEAKRIEQLERDKARLADELRKANIIISYQKKVHALLGIPLPEVPGVEER
jgi:transposase-like protein